MKVNVEVAYLDGHPTPEIVRFVKIDRSDSQDGGNTNRPIQLLYRCAVDLSLYPQQS